MYFEKEDDTSLEKRLSESLATSSVLSEQNEFASCRIDYKTINECVSGGARYPSFSLKKDQIVFSLKSSKYHNRDLMCLTYCKKTLTDDDCTVIGINDRPVNVFKDEITGIVNIKNPYKLDSTTRILISGTVTIHKNKLYRVLDTRLDESVTCGDRFVAKYSANKGCFQFVKETDHAKCIDKFMIICIDDSRKSSNNVTFYCTH